MQFKVVFALAFATFVAAAPPADSSPAKTVTNQGTTLNEVEPPFTVGETIGASKCGSAHLRCCKSTESASDAASFLKTLGYSSAKGPVGLDCTDLPAASAKTCSYTPLCCKEVHDGYSFGCNNVDKSN